jgi:hypothetical protein
MRSPQSGLMDDSPVVAWDSLEEQLVVLMTTFPDLVLFGAWVEGSSKQAQLGVTELLLGFRVAEKLCSASLPQEMVVWMVTH